MANITHFCAASQCRRDTASRRTWEKYRLPFHPITFVRISVLPAEDFCEYKATLYEYTASRSPREKDRLPFYPLPPPLIAFSGE